MRNLYLLLFIVTFGKATSQDLQNANWVFPLFNWLNFPVAGGHVVDDVATTAPTFIGHEGCATLSDRHGNLLLFSDGVRLWHRTAGTDNLVPVTLLGEPSSAQNVIFIPKPNFQNRYYIVTISGRSSTPPAPTLPRLGLRYSEIDLQGGTPVMITTNAVLSDTGGILFDGTYENVCEALTSTPHANGTDYWVIAHMQHLVAGTGWDGALYSFLVTQNGIGLMADNRASQTTPLTLPSVSGSQPFAYTAKVARTTISGHDNFAINTAYTGTFTGVFDASTGAMTINTPGIQSGAALRGYGLEFSPSGEYLYYTRGDDVRKVSTAQPVSSNTIWSQTMAATPQALQLARNEDIYVSVEGLPQLSIISTPNAATTTGFVDATVGLNLDVDWGLPQWVWKQHCEPLLIDDNDIPPGFPPVLEQRSDRMELTNLIQNNSTAPPGTLPTRAVYHALNQIELLPEDPANGINNGFEAEFGSEFAAYIAPCDDTAPFDDNFIYRHTSGSGPVKNNPVHSDRAGQIKIYPNPTDKSIHVAADCKLKRITILSIDGKIMLYRTVSQAFDEIDVSNFAKGIYLISAETADGQTHQSKFIKN